MRRILRYGAGSFLISGIVYQHLHSSSIKDISVISNDGLKKTYGYDIHFKDIKRFKYFDRKQMKCKIKPRSDHLKDLMDNIHTFDILIIGGGPTATGLLLEASMRGLSCAFIDKRDLLCEKNYCKDIMQERYIPKLRWSELGEQIYLMDVIPYIIKYRDNITVCNNLWELIAQYCSSYVYWGIWHIKSMFSPYSKYFHRPKLILPKDMKCLFPLIKEKSYGIKTLGMYVNYKRLVIQSLLTSSIECYLACMQGATIANYVEFKDFIKDKIGRAHV